MVSTLLLKRKYPCDILSSQPLHCVLDSLPSSLLQLVSLSLYCVTAVSFSTRLFLLAYKHVFTWLNLKPKHRSSLDAMAPYIYSLISLLPYMYQKLLEWAVNIILLSLSFSSHPHQLDILLPLQKLVLASSLMISILLNPVFSLLPLQPVGFTRLNWPLFEILSSYLPIMTICWISFFLTG